MSNLRTGGLLVISLWVGLRTSSRPPSKSGPQFQTCHERYPGPYTITIHSQSIIVIQFSFLHSLFPSIYILNKLFINVSQLVYGP